MEEHSTNHGGQYLIRFVQVHESFRKAEIEALADLLRIELKFLEYSEDVNFPLTQILATLPLVPFP